MVFEAMAAVLDRPIMQLTYPRYVDGVPRPDLEPKFYLSQSGSRKKLPVYVHYNGINHYNSFVPKKWPAAPKPAAGPSGGSGMGGSDDGRW